jgi:N-acetylglutamate synthase-like GNAT family acetyltransferase
MNDIITFDSKAVPLPAPRAPINVRVAKKEDIPAVDALMKKNAKALAFMTYETLVGKVALKHVLIAETIDGRFAGYLIGNDRYSSRDELGVIYQVCVVPEFRRMLVGAHLLKKRFETSAYGCKLYCCWCAQDLVESNRFYESMGFVPLAFRAGSAKGPKGRGRLHIFWQKRIREGDTTTDWWFPSETRGGLMDAARIALPIPPGMKWSDELPRLLPEELPVDSCQLPVTEKVRKKKVSAIEQPKPIRRNGLMFSIPLPGEVPQEEKPIKEKKPKPAKVKKNNPELAAKARELRDRYMEQFNARGSNLAPALQGGKYEVARLVDQSMVIDVNPKLLAA